MNSIATADMTTGISETGVKQLGFVCVFVVLFTSVVLQVCSVSVYSHVTVIKRPCL